MKIRISNFEIWGERGFEQRGDGRSDRGEEQAHERRSVLGELREVACEPEPSQRRSDGSGRRSSLKYPMEVPDRQSVRRTA
jgi:hypothetical protein